MVKEEKICWFSWIRKKEICVQLYLRFFINCLTCFRPTRPLKITWEWLLEKIEGNKKLKVKIFWRVQDKYNKSVATTQPISAHIFKSQNIWSKAKLKGLALNFEEKICVCANEPITWHLFSKTVFWNPLFW